MLNGLKHYFNTRPEGRKGTEMNINPVALEKLVDMLNIPYAGFNDHGELREYIVKALLAEPPNDGDLRFHVCNEVMNTVEPRYDLGYSYEDRSLESLQAAEDFFETLDAIVPGAFVFITTGDYIMPKCGNGHGYHEIEGQRRGHDCETYDPHYWNWIMPRSEWDRQQEEVMRRDADWRAAKEKCSFVPVAMSEVTEF